MAVHRRENQYQGVNAHLHSFLQNEPGGWESFHNAHITNLTEVIDTLLPEGYYALNEKSLQLSAFNLETGLEVRSKTKPDIGIYGGPSSGVPINKMEVSGPTAIIPVIDTLIEDDPLSSIVIFRIRDDNRPLPVTRIELLSPGNKPPGAHYLQYLIKRTETLESGLNLVEIDYLHETRSPIRAVPSYSAREIGSHAYLVLVSDLRPTLMKAETEIYGIDVDQEIPRIAIPLMGEDSIVVDFNAAYNVTFSRNRYYGMVAVDYEQLPLRFETYSEPDQQRIRDRMAAVING